MREKDSRISTGTVSLKGFLLLLFITNSACALLITVYTAMHRTGAGHKETLAEALPVFFSFGLFVLVLSLILSLAGLLWWRVFTDHWLFPLSDAARRVAAGDYSVRIPPRRKDRKKDQMDVLCEDFNTMAERLGDTKILREDFLSNVSHEFKTPLSVINSYVTLLQSGALSEEESREYLERVRLASARLSDMVGNILQLSRLERGRTAAEYTRFDLGEQLAQTVFGFDAKLTEKEIHLETDWEDRLEVESDAGLLQVVWNNLLSNAVKFTPPGGTVRILAERCGDRITVTLSDSGCGMTKEQQERMFDKFYQGDPSHATKGYGLGLAMVKSIAELLDLGIRVKSSPGEGTEVAVVISARTNTGP